MATEIRPTRWRKVYGETLTMAATIKALNKPLGARAVWLSTPTACTFQLCPLLAQAWKYVNASATYTDPTENLRDKDTATVLNLDSLATADFVYIGCDEKFRGFYVDVANTNGNASVAAVTYWNGAAWVTITPTDGTVSAGATLAQDGPITWTVPTDWVANAVNGVTKFWVRYAVGAALDASVTISSIVPLNAESNRGNLLASVVHEIGLSSSVGGIEVVESGGAVLSATWLQD